MGDERRHSEFAKVVIKQFPKAKNIINVADGKGILSRKLANKGFTVLAVEKKPRFIGKNHNRIDYKKMLFSEQSNLPEADAIIGMHPDEATGEIIGYAINNKIPFAVVPCCLLGKFSENVEDYKSWLNKLERTANIHGFTTNRIQLKISGKNIAIIGKPKK